MNNEAYITGVGAYLPGDPVGNEQLAARFGADTPRDAELRERTLAANGITARHYAVVSAVRAGEHPVAMAIGSELVSRSLAASAADTPDTSFLRWPPWTACAYGSSRPRCA